MLKIEHKKSPVEKITLEMQDEDGSDKLGVLVVQPMEKGFVFLIGPKFQYLSKGEMLKLGNALISIASVEE